MAGSVALYRRLSSIASVRFRDLIEICDHPEDLRCFLQREGLLGDFTGICKKCRKGNITYVKDGNTAAGKPAFMWKCSKKSCRFKISPRKGSFFFWFTSRIRYNLVFDILLD